VKARDIVQLLKGTFKQWSEDKASRLGAAVSYYTIFSMAPLLIVVIAIAGLAFGQKAVRGELVGQIQGVVGAESAQLIQTMIANASQPSSGILASIVGVVTLLLGASGLFGELQGALNTIWEIVPRPRGILATIRERFFSFGMVIAIAFLLLVSLVVGAGIAALGQFAGGVLPIPELALQGINFVVSFAIVTLLFALMYKVLPDAVIEWHDAVVGAAVTSLLFAIGQLAIGLYLGHSGAASTYGAAGSLIVVLLWVYYSAQIFFFGAEFTQVYANRFGGRIRPSASAMSLAEYMRTRDYRPDTDHADSSASDRQPGVAPRPAPAASTPTADGTGLPRRQDADR
jgi:membrane protein